MNIFISPHSTVLNNIEHSIYLARDTAFPEIIVIGDFNPDMNKTVLLVSNIT